MKIFNLFNFTAVLIGVFLGMTAGLLVVLGLILAFINN